MLRLAILCLLPTALLAQEASFTLAGNVVDSATGQPLAHALVRLVGFPVQPQQISQPGQAINRTALTDSGGAFRFSALPAARFLVNAQKPGYQLAAMPSTRQGTGAIDLKSSVEDVRIALAPLGVVTGKVVDDNGEPMRGVGIHALSSRVVDGLRQTYTDRTVYTDDRGEYRMWNLSPGKYYFKGVGQGGPNLLSATGNAARLEVGDSFDPVYSGGGKTVGSANPVEVAAGAKATADFRLKLEPAWQIRGTLRNYNPRESITFTLAIYGEEVTSAPDRLNRETGDFEFYDVVAGSYAVRAVQGDNTGEMAVNVAGADSERVALALYPPVDIPVTVRFTNAAPPERQPRDEENEGDGEPGCQVFLTAEQVNGNARATAPVVMQDGFLRKVVPGKQRASIRCFGAYVRSALAGTQDLLANPVLSIAPGSSPPPIDILATHGGGKITARIDASNLPSTVFQALLIPRFAGSAGPDHREGTVGPGTPANTVIFVFDNLAPGTYDLYAFGNQDNEFRNPEFLKSLSGGQTVQIDGESEKEIAIDKVVP